MRYVKLFFRLLLGAFMTYAGISHLTFNRQEFVAQVPTWLQFSPEFTDFVVLASGVVEIAFGLGIIFLVANRIMSGEGKGCCMNLIVGIIGSYVGTFISHVDSCCSFPSASYLS